MEKKSNNKFYQKWWFWAIVAFFSIGAIGYISNPDAYKTDTDTEITDDNPEMNDETTSNETTVKEYISKYDLATTQGEIEDLIVKRITDKMHSWVSIDSISVNEDYGTDVPDDYTVLVYTTWSGEKDDRSFLEEAIPLYCNDLAAYAVEKYSQVQEITIFWMIPSLSTKTNSAKCNYEQTDGAMYLMHTIGIISDKMENGQVATKTWKDTAHSE